jgi:hypothetical protein
VLLLLELSHIVPQTPTPPHPQHQQHHANDGVEEPNDTATDASIERGAVPVKLTFEAPFVARLYNEVEQGYECCPPNPLENSRNATPWVFTLSPPTDPIQWQTAADTGGGLQDAACSTIAFAGSASSNGAFLDVKLTAHGGNGASASTDGAAGGAGADGDADVTDGADGAEGGGAGAWAAAEASTPALLVGETIKLGVVLTISSDCSIGQAAAADVAAHFDEEWAAAATNHEARCTVHVLDLQCCVTPSVQWQSSWLGVRCTS